MLSARLRELARAVPKRPALDSADGRLSFRDLDAAADRVAAFLLERSGRGRHRIGICAVADHAALVAACGVNRAGKIAVPLDPFHPVSLLQEICADASMSAVLTDLADVLGAEALGPPMVSLDQCFEGPAPQPVRVPVSGATGLHYLGAGREPLSGIVVSDHAALRWAEALTRDDVVRDGSRCALAWSGSDPDNVERLVALALCAASVVTGQTDQDLAAVLESGAIDAAWVATPTLRRLRPLSTPAVGVRAVALFDGPMTAGDVARARGWFGDGVAVTAYWARPETGVLAALTVGPDDDVPGGGLLPAGWCTPDVEVETVDANGCRTGADDFGHVVVWGDTLPGAYWANPGLTERRWLGGGPDGRRWCTTGERGRWDDRGRLVLDRALSPDAVLMTASSSSSASPGQPALGTVHPFVSRAS